MEAVPIEWLVGILSGVVGGDLAGFANRLKLLGPGLNSVLGGAGGALGGHLGPRFAFLEDLGQGGDVAAGGVLGLVLPLIAGHLEKGGSTPS